MQTEQAIDSRPNADPRTAPTLAERLRRRAAGVARRPRTFWVPPLAPQHSTLAARAVHWLLPWRRQEYPGIGPGVSDLLGHSVTVPAIRAWRSGRNRLPAEVARQLATVIRARSLSGLAVAEELEAHAEAREAEARPLYGIAAMHAARREKSPCRGRGGFRASAD